MKQKLLDIIIIVFIIALGAFFFYLISNNQFLGDRIQAQELKASALISEVGQARDENNMLYQKLQESHSQIENLEKHISEIERSAETSAFFEPTNSQTDEPSKIHRPVENNQPEVVQIPRQAALNTVNFLLVGEHMRLADTIILAVVNLDSQKIVLINVPRDLFVNGRKINEYLSLYGIETLAQKVEEVSGFKINNYAVFNLKAFKNIVDALGGIDINVDRDIYDNAYPDGLGGYTVYNIRAGLYHMDGNEALKYARSRHSTSDFDRSKRQQQVLLAIKQKALNLGLLNNFDEIQKIFDALKNDIEVDISLYDAVRYFIEFKDYRISLGNILSTANFLYSTTNISGQYILLPQDGNFGAIQRYMRDILK